MVVVRRQQLLRRLIQDVVLELRSQHAATAPIKAGLFNELMLAQQEYWPLLLYRQASGSSTPHNTEG